ncbi:hypothetical protein SADUNF_Sadunf06G0042000 [Salix dunnii]|uniref:Leucine-rich repeat-containing N-terminal plant-type domain-containing protein n=1 Tax=Salix dunnii TaxID=1413687 RepID=A0A835N2P9_9ROSI|nr:hypothetical protein SADUNF_Sadunf06G0042000 [Salix dunnii]
MKTLFLSLLISTLLSLSLSQELCNSEDKQVLLQIKKHFGDPYLLASWKSDTDCCKDWYQVECDSTTNRIISLTVFAGNLSGQIPAAVGDLPYLQNLVFRKLTDITGPIQPAIAKLVHLTFLRLDWLNLTGTVPDFLSELKNLTFLDLSFNGFSGSIPSSLALLPNLGALHLDRNKLTGSIPESFGTFKGSVPDLYLSHNQLTGEIPASLGNMDFSVIDLSRNQLVGDASMLFGPNKTTNNVYLSRNLFEFNLSNVVFPSTIENLDINHNKIFGSIPPQMTQLPLQTLNVSYNRLCGQIPVGGKSDTGTPKLSKKTVMVIQLKECMDLILIFSVFNPQSIHEQIGTDCCKAWNQVKCDPTTNRIVSLRMFSGNLSGEIPAEVGELPYLKTLELHKLTNITGPIPTSISNLINLISLTLSRLNLSGPVPDSLSNLKNLRVLDLSFNSLSGSIPSSLALLPEIDILGLDRNKLTGTIPESFGNFVGRVPAISLSHNQLSGKIPASLDNRDFRWIDFSRNKLEGDASMFFGPNKTIGVVDLSRNLLEFDFSKVVFPTTLTNLDINHNKIFGSIPNQMTQLSFLSLNVSYNRLCGLIPQGGKLPSLDYTAYFHNKCLCGTPLESCK